MRRVLSRAYAADYVALVYVVAYYAWLSVRTPGTPLTQWIGDVSFYPLGVAVGLAYLRNARIASLDTRTRWAWGILGSGALALWLIGNTWPRLVTFFGADAYPAWVGVLEIVQHALLIAALLTFPSRPVDGRDRARFAVDASLVVVAGFLMAFHFGLRITLRTPPAGPQEVAIAQALLDWLVFATAAIGVMHKRDHTIRVTLGWLLAASVLYLMANYQLSQMSAYRLGDAVDGLWFAAWVCRWAAARVAWHRYRGHHAGAPEPAAHNRYQGGVLSYLLVAGAFFLLIAQAGSGDRQYIELLAASAAVMALLLVIRQVVGLRENQRQFAARLQQEARFRSMVQHASDLIVVIDACGRIGYASPSTARVLGDGVAAAGTRLVDLLHPDDAAALAPLAEPAVAPGWRAQCRMGTAHGDWRDVELVATDLRGDPAVKGIVLNGRDVTDRNELERQLRHAQKLDAVGHLAGGLAHDFNNVLTAIRGYTELLRETISPESPAAEDLAQIEQSVERAAAVTRKLLAFSRRQAVQRSALDLNGVLLDLQPLLRQLLTDRIEVRLDLDPDLWRIKADQGQIEQVVVNLVTNARDAMAEGGPLLVATANRSIAAVAPDTGGLPPGDYVALVVNDQGTGMSPEVRARIFEPFYSTKPRDRGMGLGLAMVHGIVVNSGGYIAVDSTPGHGTTLTVLLPRTRDMASVASAPQRLPATRPPGPRVLLVDDELGGRTIMRRILEQGGFSVVEAASGADALAVLDRGESADLLVTDISLAGMPGAELIRHVRDRRPGLPVVLVRGRAATSPGALPAEMNVAAVLTRPVEAEALLRAAAAACAGQVVDMTSPDAGQADAGRPW
jgi:PAS domain S-box-containing protein